MSRRFTSAQPLVLAVLCWCVSFLVVVGLVFAGYSPTLSYDVYQAAGQRWWTGDPLYETSTNNGFQYFPQAAILLVPFAKLGSPIGGLLWRLLWWGSSALGVWRLSRALAPDRERACFLLATSLAIGLCVGALANGQANLALAALTLHATAELNAQRWWRATLILALGLALKPLLLVLLLLVWVCYRELTWRIPAALGFVFVAPWLVGHHAYVVGQYAACLTKLGVSVTSGPHHEDLRGLLAPMGWGVPRWLAGAAALATLAASVRAHGRIREPYSNLLIAGFSVAYLMLFNPRTQSTSYSMAGVVVALLATVHLFQQRKLSAAVLFIIVAAWTVNYRWPGFGAVECWLKPLGCVAFFGSLLASVWAPPESWRSDTPAPLNGEDMRNKISE